MVQVHFVAGNDASSSDVVFLHGLEGDWNSTWSSGKQSESWLDWLATDNTSLSVWSVSYPAAATRWHGDSMPIRDRATSMLGALAYAHDIGTKPFILIGHSLGGLVIKQMIRHSVTMGDQYAQFTAQLVGVVFFSTPHTGSGLASLAKYIRMIRATPLIDELVTNQAYLRELDDWYRNYVTRNGLPNLSFYEKQNTRGIRVVGESSGDPHLPGTTAIPVDADHRTICKFTDRSNPTYRQIQRFIINCIQSSPRQKGPIVQAFPSDPILPNRATLPTGSTSQVDPHPGGNLRGSRRDTVNVDSLGAKTLSWSHPEAMNEIVILALLSEQLPTGGWTRSLAHWMTRYAEASGREAPDRPPMRIHGGIDVTCAAVRRLVAISDNGSIDLREALEDSIRAGTLFLRKRTPSGGAVGATIHTRTPPTEVRVRHTAITLGTLLKVQDHFGEMEPYPEVTRCARYLRRAIANWRQDTTGTFGMLAAAWNLREYLSHDNRILSSTLSDELQDLLSTAVDEMADAVVAQIGEKSNLDNSAQQACAMFGAYGHLSALAKSSFLFSAKLLTSLQPNHPPLGIAQQSLYEELQSTCSLLAHSVIQGKDHSGGLLTVPSADEQIPDLGLSAQLLSVLLDLLAVKQRNDIGILAATNILQDAIESALYSGDDARLSAHLRYSHGVQLAELFDKPETCDTLSINSNLPVLISNISGLTMSQKYIVEQICACAERRHGRLTSDDVSRCRALGAAWSRVLEGGYYFDKGRSQAEQGSPWVPGEQTRDSLRRLRESWESAGTSALWIYDEGETAAGLVRNQSVTNIETSDGTAEYSFQDWMSQGGEYVRENYSILYLPTATTSRTIELFSNALRRSRALLEGPYAVGIVCIRFGDHRIVSYVGEAITFLEDTSHLDRILHTCQLRLIGLEVESESLDGVECIARFGHMLG